MIIICKICNEEFKVFVSDIKYGKKYCSFKCRNIGLLNKVVSLETRKKMSDSHKKEKHNQWKGGFPNCKDCGKKLAVRKSKLGVCGQCKGKYFRGENNPSWKGGNIIKKNERNDPSYHRWRQSVYYRDNFKCKIENKDCNGRIEAHHILGWSSHPELRYQINNGITLCQTHHPHKRVEEKRLSPYFQDLILTSSI